MIDSTVNLSSQMSVYFISGVLHPLADSVLKSTLCRESPSNQLYSFCSRSTRVFCPLYAKAKWCDTAHIALREFLCWKVITPTIAMSSFSKYGSTDSVLLWPLRCNSYPQYILQERANTTQVSFSKVSVWISITPGHCQTFSAGSQQS